VSAVSYVVFANAVGLFFGIVIGIAVARDSDH
jgi:hypothetical protein